MKKLTLLYFLIASTPVFAEAAAKILSTTNKVTVNGVAVTRGANVSAGDAIVTAADAAANIKYTNGTLVNIGANSNYKILAYSPNKADVQIKAQLDTGSIHTKTDGKTKESVKTPVVALAVLGTEFQLAVSCNHKETKQHQQCKKVINLEVIEGRVQAGATVLTAGSSVLITSPSSIKPAPFPPALQVNAPAGEAGAISSSSSSGTSNGAGTSASNTMATSSVSLTTVQTTSTSTSSSATASVIPFVPSPPIFAPTLPRFGMPG